MGKTPTDRRPTSAVRVPAKQIADRDNYHRELGRFIDMFAKVEMELQLALWHYAKTTKEVSRAIFSGTRIDGSIKFIRRILAAQKSSDSSRTDLEFIFAQITAINDVRNDIIHHGAHSISGGYAIITNSFIALTKEHIKTHRIAPGILSNMTFDLIKILVHLRVRHSGRKVPPTIEKHVQPWLHASWQYKPPQPPLARNRNPPHVRGRSRQPES